MSEKFGPWLTTQLSQRNMSQAELARKLETSNSTVSNWANGARVPIPDSCARIAEVLRIPRDTVLSAAGHRTRSQDEWPSDVMEVASVMLTLPAYHRNEVLEFARWRQERSTRRGEGA